jgi:AraC-like DNA-binding protein
MSPTGELTWIIAPALPGVELTRARVASPRAMAFLGQLVLLRCDAGAAEARWAGHIELLRPGAVLVQPADAPPMVLRRAAPKLEYRLVRVEPARLPTTAAGGAALVTWAPAVVAGIDELFAAVEDHHADSGTQRARLRTLLAAALARSAIEHRAVLTPAIARARATLQARYAENVRLPELAALAGMSPCHLVHLFHREVGLPPHAYQIHLRVAHARTLVAAGVPLIDVASRTGFSDQSHLTRLFKRVTGLSPGRFAALYEAPPAPGEPLTSVR